MKLKAYAKRPWITHSTAVCNGGESRCDFNKASHGNTAAIMGRRHAKNTGHELSIQTIYVQLYNPYRLKKKSKK